MHSHAFLATRQSLELGENVRQAGVLRMYGDQVNYNPCKTWFDYNIIIFWQVKDKASVSVVACEQGKGRGTLQLEHEDGHLGF